MVRVIARKGVDVAVRDSMAGDMLIFGACVHSIVFFNVAVALSPIKKLVAAESSRILPRPARHRLWETADL